MNTILIIIGALAITIPLSIFMVRVIFKNSIVTTVIQWTLVIIFLVSLTGYYVGTTKLVYIWFILPINFIVAGAIFVHINKILKAPLVNVIKNLKDISSGN